MNHKKKLILLIVLSLIVIFGGYVLSYPEKFNICGQEQWSCISFFSFQIGEPLFIGGLSLLLTFILLLFFSQEIFNVWKKFAVWYIPIAIILLAITPTSDSAFLAPDREIITWFTSIAFLVVSLIIIRYKQLQK